MDWRRDLHFQTRTTIDTLDYSGTGFNQGSKVVIAATGRPGRELAHEVPSSLSLPDGFEHVAVVLPGVLAVCAPAFDRVERAADLAKFADAISAQTAAAGFPLITLCDDAKFAAADLRNWLWTTFTRSNPAVDIGGVDAFELDKHWGCRGPLIIDARVKPHHAPPLIEDPQVTAKVDARATRHDSLAKYL